jgi:hypothetical protein
LIAGHSKAVCSQKASFGDADHITPTRDLVSLTSEPVRGPETTRRLIDQQVSLQQREVPMKTMNQESKTALENKATYRAPRLVALGTAESLVQFGRYGKFFDSAVGNGRSFYQF